MLGLQVGLLAALALWSLRLIAYKWQMAEIDASLLHLVNLPFHEFGHVLFWPFGEWLMFLGGLLAVAGLAEVGIVLVSALTLSPGSDCLALRVGRLAVHLAHGPHEQLDAGTQLFRILVGVG